MLIELYQTWLKDYRPARRLDKMLWVSDLGYHLAKAMRRVLDGAMTPFEPPTLLKMQSGVALEGDTFEAIKTVRGGVITQFPLFNDVWSGYADAVLGHGTPKPMIVEHKATSELAWKNLVKAAHLCQLWLYGELYAERFGLRPTLILFYRTWNKFAEFQLMYDPAVRRLYIDGVNDGKPTSRSLAVDPRTLRLELESYYQHQTLPEDESGVDSWTYAEDAYNRKLPIR